MSFEAKKKQLKDEIAKLEKLEKDSKKLRTLESYTDKEKIEFFNQVYKFAKDIIDSKLNDKDWSEDNDNDHWAFELVMEILGKGIWDVYNGSD